MRSAHGISFEVRPSARLSRFVLLVVALATIAPLFTSLPWMARWPLAGVIAAIGFARAAHGRRPVLAQLDWAFDGLWTVRERSGRAYPAELVASRVVEAWRDLLCGCNDPFNDVVRADGDPILDVRGPVPTRGSNDL